jgi:hypothetical protein
MVLCAFDGAKRTHSLPGPYINAPETPTSIASKSATPSKAAASIRPWTDFSAYNGGRTARAEICGSILEN